ncbi:DNA topoisomerase family protein [Alteromonas oceanisediminis]|uniref:DNA topoisomerase family protein n=1 Tax=Alteromonas oceanisediminis TaxID=2836180 RepID=UPI001BDB1AA8|nr:topoisomerase DNA-binding C4 zinc finger domain-containing protein [Alteromonas oceanisediminis]MBT0586650.1 topoisomerase DNA-binding C4 zinc finger domain-containing protein [Alteromonas oceanisediminis]
MSKIDHALFGAHNHALADAFGACPKCDAQLVIRRSKKGAFIGCATYPECDYTKPLHDTETQTLKQIDGSLCPECEHSLAIKKGRYGLFIGCTNAPECHHITSLKPQANTEVNCPACSAGKLVKRTNRFGKVFYSCNQYPRCKYVVNHKPVGNSCSQCGWGILVDINNQWQCPQPDCHYTQPAQK